MEMNFREAVDLGRQSISDGNLEGVRECFSISYTRLAAHLGTNSKTLKRWIADPDFAARIHDTTAARIGEFVSEQLIRIRSFWAVGVDISTLYPLSLLAGEMGKSTTSPSFQKLCRTGEIACYDMGMLGTYIPATQAAELRGKK